MIGSLIYLLVYLAVIGLVMAVALWLIGQIPLPAPFAQIARVVIIVIACLAVILLLLGLVDGPGPIRLEG